MLKKIITIILLISIATMGVMPQKANAIFGVADITINPEGVVGWLTDAAKWLADVAWRTTLATLKKRLLDKIVNDIIFWIQGGLEGRPGFVENPGNLFRDAANEAVGDVVTELGYANLCSPNTLPRLDVQLNQAMFSQKVSCTLDDVLDGFEGTIENFREDFRTGGWLAYTETLKPQNNRWGIEVMAQSEAEKRQSQQTSLAQYEASVGNSFVSKKRCTSWEKVEGEFIGTIASGDGYFTKTPENDDGETFRYNGNTNRPSGSEWRCVDPRTITPGSLAGDMVSSAIKSDIDFIVNSDDLSTYAAAIIDAAINKLVQVGLDEIGLIDIGEVGLGAATDDCNGLTGDLLQACLDYRDTINDSVDTANDAISTISLTRFNAMIDVIESIISSLEVIDIDNNNIIEGLDELQLCQESEGLDVDEDIEDLRDEAEERSDQITQYISELETVIADIENIINNPPENIELVQDSLIAAIEDSIKNVITENELERIETETSEVLSDVKNRVDACGGTNNDNDNDDEA
ncbi:MAG: hypothetical protein WDZ80_04900 [Candidatus Paceibacterota bacterium]